MAAVSAESTPPGETDDDAGEAALAGVIACAEDECVPDFKFRRHVGRRREGRGALEIADDDVGIERPATGDQRACRIERAAPPVEHEVVVAAVLVDVNDRHLALARHRAEHLFAALILAD